jgi:trehalose 6-phosphate phosphatase
VSPAATIAEALEPLRSDPSRGAVLLDIDGTLAPIVRHADDAHVPEATRSLLIEISRRYRLVGCVSGRRAATARQIVAIGSIAYVGNHGGELLRPGATKPELDPELSAWADRVHEFAARAYTPERERARVRQEDKEAIAAFHWRGAPDEQAAAVAVREIADEAERDGFAVHWGRKVLEVRPPVELDKGLGVTALLGGLGTGSEDAGPTVARAVYVGDDSTDVDAFRALQRLVEEGKLELAVCVAVGSEETPPELLERADMTIDGQSGVRGLLQALL